MDHPALRMDIAERVLAARREAGLSLDQVAERTGIPYRTLRRRVEVAPGKFTIDELGAIAEVTGSSLDYLLAGAAPVGAAA